MCMDEQYCEASSKPALTMPTVVPESVQLPSGPIAGQPADPPAANAREGYAAGVASVALLCHLQVEASYYKAIWEIVKPKVVRRLAFDQALTRKHPSLNVIVVADSDGNPADDLLSGFYDSGSEDPGGWPIWRRARGSPCRPCQSRR
ncbi:unnamed protein product [Symbiodinium necroappetens]|uniref:Uncharacterized protein n=1 Tax=Symbiodinium necroappetens TaxID=1628268 RepID=A0A812Y2Y8_9DINO|nr:unnamed protein product [Symbiodinium necroappetens]